MGVVFVERLSGRGARPGGALVVGLRLHPRIVRILLHFGADHQSGGVEDPPACLGALLGWIHILQLPLFRDPGTKPSPPPSRRKLSAAAAFSSPKHQ